jgi:hypothetical protein
MVPLLTLFFTAVGFYDIVLSQLLPDGVRKHFPTVSRAAADFAPWYVWMMIAAGVLIVGTLEGAYQFIRTQTHLDDDELIARLSTETKDYMIMAAMAWGSGIPAGQIRGTVLSEMKEHGLAEASQPTAYVGAAGLVTLITLSRDGNRILRKIMA